MHKCYLLLSYLVSIGYPLLRISLKLSIFLLDLIEYKASLIWNIVPHGNIIAALPEPSIKSAGPDIVFTLASTHVMWEKYF